MLEISVPILPNSRKNSSFKAILKQHMSMLILDSPQLTLIQQRDKDKTKPSRCSHLIASKREISAHAVTGCWQTETPMGHHGRVTSLAVSKVSSFLLEVNYAHLHIFLPIAHRYLK